jgi:hypothetical protein
MSGAARFDERLSVPWWWWPPALGVVLLVAFQVNLGHPGVPMWLPVAVLAPLVAWFLYRLGAVRVRVVSGGAPGTAERSLRVGPATIPVRLLGDPEIIGRRDKQRALGPDLDPTAYLVHRPWVGPMLKVTVRDAEDPTPYWLFSVRNPARLRELLEADRPG